MTLATRIGMLGLVGLFLCLLLGGGGCSSDDPGQIDTVQVLANALMARDLKAACAMNVPRLRDPISCDSIIVPLMHYSPGFRAARITRRGPASGWRLSRQVKVPVHYEGPDGKGDLDVTMQRTPEGWRIALIVPLR